MNIFKKKPPFQGGVLPDNRSTENKLKDYNQKELVTAPVVEWKVKPQNQWKSYPVQNQDGSGSCVAQATSKTLAIENWLEENVYLRLSARDIYSRRMNMPYTGMYCYNACDIAVANGATLETLMTSENKGEAEMNTGADRKPSYEIIGKIFKPKEYVHIAPPDIDRIALAISQGHSVMLAFNILVSEWDRPVPVITALAGNSGHCVTAVDYVLYNGQKALIIDDSWGQNYGLNGQRVVTADWITKRCTWASYFIDLNNSTIFNQQTEKIKYQWLKDLYVGCVDEDVRILQLALATIQDNEGYLFPLNTQKATTWFGGITRTAVKRFQNLYKSEILIPSGLTTPTGYVGEATRKVLNNLFK